MTNGVQCLYLLADAEASDRSWLEARGFVPVDKRLTLESPLSAAVAVSWTGIRHARPTDIPVLREIAAASHRATRFFADARLAPRAPALYQTWIEKSVNGMSDAVFVVDADGVSGYVTCEEPEPGVGRIGLLGVAPHAQGRGFGRQLISAALAWFKSSGCTVSRVVTQGGNSRAVAVYQRAGFRPVRVEQWYHRWFLTARA